jgi:hypothetical protein
MPPTSASPSSSMLAVASPTATPAPIPTVSDSPSTSPSPTASPALGLPAGREYSDLDGVAAPADLAHRLPLGLMIDDYKNARPNRVSHRPRSSIRP